MSVAPRASATPNGNSTTAAATVPASAQVGDVILLHLSLNNTDVITSVPSGLTLIDNDTTTSSTFPNRLYWAVVDGVTISASTVLSFSLSATRAWEINLTVWSGVSNTTPLTQAIAKAAGTATNAVMPSITTTAQAYLVEIMSGKSNGTSITSWTAPSGWTNRGTTSAVSTFAGSANTADNNSGAQAPGTYGGETYTPSSACSVAFRYIVPLNPAGTNLFFF